MARDKEGFEESQGMLPQAKSSGSEKNHNAGHRDRLRDRFSQSMGEAIADYELLELLLFRSVPRQDTKPIAKDLLARFGSFAEVLGAPEKLLQEVKGVGPSVARDLKIIASAASRMSRGNVIERPILSSGSNVLEYCRTTMAFETIEQLRILFLDKKNVLIADEVLQRGTVDHTPVYPREIAKRALELSAVAIILVHNHPSGDVTPSQADVSMTKKIIDTLDPLDISVHDHIVVGKNGHSSMRAMELI